jgi:hypothetical protein
MKTFLIKAGIISVLKDIVTPGDLSKLCGRLPVGAHSIWYTECCCLIACKSVCTFSSAILLHRGWQTVTIASEGRHTSATSVAGYRSTRLTFPRT